MVRIRKMLVGLYPGKSQEIIYEEYFVKKIKTFIQMLMVMFTLLVLIVIRDNTTSIVDSEGRLNRADMNGVDYNAELIAKVDDEEIDIGVTVANQKYTEEETNKLYASLIDQIEVVILGNNASLIHVTEDLNLVNSVEGYPFDISWESNNYDLLHDNGKVVNELEEDNGKEVLLKCIVTYANYKFEKTYKIMIFPKEKSLRERTKDEIIASIQTKQIETQNEKYLQLPMSVNNKEIEWKESPQYTSLIVAILASIVLIGEWLGVDNDLTKKYRKRDQLLRIDYSEFVSKLQLLISSGMTLRGAFERMEADYKYALKNDGKTKYVYEELSICLKRLRDGASETEIYIMFGNRCGQVLYKKLMSLLVQNLRKGTSGLIEALEYEAKCAFEERKHIARRLGDEAQTKLLFPMILMLGVVMIIILVPAYFSFAL